MLRFCNDAIFVSISGTETKRREMENDDDGGGGVGTSLFTSIYSARQHAARHRDKD